MAQGRRIATAVAALVVASFALAAPAAAETGVVTTDADGFADGTLRHEVANANTSEVVTFAPGVNPKLTIPAPVVIASSISIQGNGANETVISRTSGQHRIFNVDGDPPSGIAASISGVTITGGQAPDAGASTNGGGILVASNNALTLSASVVTLNQAGDGSPGADGLADVNPGVGLPGGQGGNGGGIWSDGYLTVVNSTISDNAAGDGGRGGDGGDSLAVGVNGANAGAGGSGGIGGGIFSLLALQVSGSTFTGNAAGDGGDGGSGGRPGDGAAMGTGGAGGTGGNGGGLAITGGGPFISPPSVLNSTIFENVAGRGVNGGVGPAGVQQPGGASGSGGGVFTSSAFPIGLVQVTIAGNASPIPDSSNPPALAQGAGILTDGGTTQVNASVFSQNQVVDPGEIRPANCFGLIGSSTGSPDNIAFPDGGAPFGDPGSCTVSAVGDPLLGDLADNGGPTQTMAIGLGGAAIEAVPVGPTCLATDQRGVTRPQGTSCDAGAFERNPETDDPSPATPSPPPISSQPTSPSTGETKKGSKKKKSCKRKKSKRKRKQCQRKRKKKR